MKLKALVALLLLPGLTGCVSSYLFESRGTVTAADGEPTPALLYWRGDDGRLWYGKRYRQIDTGVTMLVCGKPPRTFDAEGMESELYLGSRSGDLRVAEINESGQFVAVSPPEPVRPDTVCGRVMLADQPAASDALRAGTEPAVLIVCRNTARPDRYPTPGAYPFRPVSRTRAKGDIEPSDVCAPPAP